MGGSIEAGTSRRTPEAASHPLTFVGGSIKPLSWLLQTLNPDMHPLTFVGGSIEAARRFHSSRCSSYGSIRSRSWAAPSKQALQVLNFRLVADAHPLTFVGGFIEARVFPWEKRAIRSGGYSERGIHKNALVIPVVGVLRHVGESGVLYKWIKEECKRLGILFQRNSG